MRGRRRKKAVAPLHFYTPAGYNHVILSGSHPLPAGTIPSRALFWEVLHVIKVGIVGASGYTGGELMRILFGHPSASIVYVGSRSLAGKRVRDVLPAVPPWCDLEFEEPDPDRMAERCDVIFTAPRRPAAWP